MINDGKLVLDDSLDQVKHDFQGISILDAVLDKELLQIEIPNIESIEIDGCNVQIKLSSE